MRNNNAIHLVFLCNEYPPYTYGGIGIFVQTIAQQLIQIGWIVEIVGIYPVEKDLMESDRGVTVHRLKGEFKRGLTSLVDTFRINRYLRQIHQEFPIDLIETQEAGLALLPNLFPAQKIVRMHGGHTFFSRTLGRKPRFWRGFLERVSFARADAICAVSRYVAETTRELKNLDNRRITILPNPIDIDRFCPRPVIKEEQGMILFVGTVTEKKGIRQLIEALPAIRKVVPNAHLYIVGKDTVNKKTGKSFTDYLKKNMPQDTSGSIRFVGTIPNNEVSDWVARAQVCVYPSHMEAQGIVVIEAMASGKAVVASKTGPGPELITDGVDGLLCDPHDPSDIADKVIRLLKNPVLRLKLGQMARKRVEENYSLDVMVGKNISFYKKVLSEK